MSRFNAGKASLLVLTAAFAVSAFLLGKSLTSVSASKTNLEWKETDVVWGECFLNDEGKVRQSKTVTYTCEEKEGKNADCTLGQTKIEEEEKNNCNVEKAYCHATESEGHPYNYHFNKAWVEHIRNNGTPQSGHELDFFTWEGDRDCVGFTKVCTDEKADNYDSDLAVNEISDNKVCEYSNTETSGDGDICANLDGVQTSVPEGLHLSGANNDQCVAFSQAGVQDPTGPAAPQTQGQVLGASTMAKTGTFDEALYLAIMSLGGILTTIGAKKAKKAFKVAR